MRSVCFVILLCAAAAPARAEDAAHARAMFDKGTTLYDLGKYLDAAHAYEEAYSAKSDAALLFNIAQAYRLGGDYAAALRSYKSFLRRLPSAPNRNEVERHIATLQKLLDEQKSASSSPPQGTFAPGQQIAPSAEAREHSVEPAANAPATATAVTSEAPPKKTPVYKKWWLWTVVGVAVVGVGLGLGLGLGLQGGASAPSSHFGTTTVF